MLDNQETNQQESSESSSTRSSPPSAPSLASSLTHPTGWLKKLKAFDVNDVGQLRVVVYAAEGLAAADLNGKSDPFAVIKLINNECQTITQYRNLNPEWNETFTFKITDINATLDILVWDEDRHGADFLGRVSIPLLKVVDGRKLWYQLKDKKLQNNAKGKILLEISTEWSIFKAAVRTFNPSETIKNKPDPTFKRTLLVSNFNRLKCQILKLLTIWRYIQSCFSWESRLRSSTAFLIFISVTYFFEIWMTPAAILMLYIFNYILCRNNSPDDDHQTLIIPSDDQLNDSSFEDFSCHNQQQMIHSYSKWYNPSNNNNNNNNYIYNNFNNNNNPTATNQQQQSEQQQNDNRSILEKIQAVQDVVILVQDIIGEIASYGERLVNSFKFRVPFLSHLMMFCLLVATIILYFVPLRLIVMLWGINKFTKKLRNPYAIDNNELVDYLSRVPDNVHLMKYHNEISETITRSNSTSNSSSKTNRMVTVCDKNLLFRLECFNNRNKNK